MKKKRATKLLLDSYYSTESNEEGPIAKEIEMEKGGEDTPSDRDHDEPVSVAADPSDLDSNGFDVGKYLERTLSTLPLCELLGEERRLGAEARALDGEMKTLVYENYHKFVIATNTVDSMHRNVGAIEAGLQKLSADVSAAGVCVNSISASLEAKRARLQHLRSVEAHLVRLRAAADLPQRLEQCVSLGAYREAVEYYTRTAALFEHNRTLPSFARISGECAAVIAELKQRLWADLSPQAPRDAKHDTSLAFARTFPGDRVADAAEMLIDLGEPAAAVREAFLETCYSRGAFSAALGALSTSASTIEAETASSVFFSLLAQAHCGYERVFHGIKSVADTDGSSSGDGGNSGGTRTLRSTLAEGAEMYIVTLQRWLATHAQVSSSSNNSNKSRQTLSEEVGFAERLCALARQAAALSASAQTGPNGLTSLGLAERVACVAGDFFGLLVDRVFGDALDSTVAAVVPPLREGCAAHSKAVAAAAGGVSGDSEFVLFWDGTAGSASEAVASAVDAALDEVRVFVTPEFGRTFGDCVADIVIRVHSEMQQFFFKLRERFAALVASYYNPLEPPFMPMLALALCSVVTKVDSLVEPLCEKVADEFKLGNGSEVIVIHVSEIHSAYASLTEDLIDAFVAAESAVLNADAASYARALSVDSSSSSSSPPTPAMDAFVQGIVSVDACLTALFHVSPAEKKSAQHSSRRFYEAGRWSKSTEHFSYEYVLERVVENALRALSECVRLHTYAEDNRYTSDKSSLENALVGCYGGLSELTLLLDKIELDVHCRTVRAVTDETETETKGEEKTQEEEKKEEETAET